MLGVVGTSIRKKLMLVLLVTNFSVLFLATTGFVVSDWYSSKAENYEQLRSQAGIVGSNSLAALMFNDVKSATRTLTTLDGEANIIAAVLYDAENTYFTSFQRNDYKPPYLPPKQGQGLLNGAQYVILPILLDEEPIGSILLVSEQANWRERQYQRLLVVFGLFFIALLVVVLMSSRLQNGVTKPIIKLANTAQRITQTKDFSLRAQKLSKDEIGSLVDDFNEMLNQIQSRDSELLEARQSLEEKVEERTSELYELTRRLEHQAEHDALTDLFNRDAFDRGLKSAINYASRHHRQQAVFFLDLDRFKTINDTLGHGVGDKLLIEVARRLTLSLRGSDILARLGGDEFAVLLFDTSPEKAAEVAVKLIAVIHEPMKIEGFNLQVSTSLGISVYPNDGDSAEAILKNADTAMYASKEAGRNRFSFYETQMNARAERRLLLENKMRDAVNQNLFRLVYQPKWDVMTKKLIGVEALIRWDDPHEGAISPAEFIPLAEDCGLIGEIDNWVLMTACKELKKLFAGNSPSILLSVNFSAAHLIRKDICEGVESVLNCTGYPGNRLELEITETVVTSEIAHLNTQLHAIRELGVEISIDDFGVAYSSLSRLKQLPLNTLKIDRSFIRDIGNDKDDEVIVRTIIDMAHNLNLKVVAEGVETEEQYQFIREHHCDVVQGFYFGRPMSIAEIGKLVHHKEHNSVLV